MSKIKLTTTFPLLPFLANNATTATQARNLGFISFIQLVTKSYQIFLLHNNLSIPSPFNNYLSFPNFIVFKNDTAIGILLHVSLLF